MNMITKLLNPQSHQHEPPKDDIPSFLSFKTANKLVQKNCSAKLSKKANESINIFLEEFLICLVRHRNQNKKYNIVHFKKVFSNLILNDVLLNRCIEETKSICTQFVTGLSLNHVQSIQNAINNPSKIDMDHGGLDFKLKYFNQLKYFCLNNCNFNTFKTNQSNTMNFSDCYFSLSVGLFISNGLEQIIRYFLFQLVQFCESQNIQTLSADHVAYIVNMDHVLSNIANKTYYFQRLQFKIDKPYQLETSLNFNEEKQKISVPPLNQILLNNFDEEWLINIDESMDSEPKKTRMVYSFPKDKLTNQLYSNVSLNQDKANEFEALIGGNETMKLSLTSSRMRSLDKSNPYY